VLEEFFRTGVYRPRAAAQTHATSSPSMDISKASNFERFVFDLMDRDPQRLAALWRELERDGQFDLSVLRPVFESRYGFVSGTSSHADRLATIRQVHETCGVLIDPHTADGVKVAQAYLEEGVPMLVLETALPAKFAETIREALDIEPPVPTHLQGLSSLPQKVVHLPCDVERVREYLREHAPLPESEAP